MHVMCDSCYRAAQPNGFSELSIGHLEPGETAVCAYCGSRLRGDDYRKCHHMHGDEPHPELVTRLDEEYFRRLYGA